MIKNVQDSEVLVYIRRVSEGSEGVGGIIGQWDYYQMAALPLRDNPRYQFAGDSSSQDVVTSYYYKFNLFSNRIKVQIGPYDVTTGVLVGARWTWGTGVTQAATAYEYVQMIGSGDTGQSLYYPKFPTGYIYVTVPDSVTYQDNAKLTLDFKSVSADITPEEIDLMTNEKFQSYPPIYYINDIPKQVPQTGLISIYDDFGDYIKPYSLTYTRSKSLLEHDLESLQPDPPVPLIEKGDQDDETIAYIKKVVETIKDPRVRSTDGTTFEKRRFVGVQSKTIPLHEISNKAEGVECKATHLAYRIGAVDKEAPYEYWTGSQDKLTHDYQPCVYLFNNHKGFYKRLPECWPWSCRRFTVESVLNTGINKYEIKYYKQNYRNGDKDEVDLEDIPKLDISLTSFLDDTAGISPYFLNSPPSESTLEEKDYINGYYFFEKELENIEEDQHAIQCGCEPDDEKITMALEMFPLLDKSLCKLIVKAGFLCYPTKSCTVPNLGYAYKKIIYPFNSCVFNETINIPFRKMDLPPVTLDSNQVIFEATGDDNIHLSYVLLGRKIFTDPYYHPSGVKQQLTEDVIVPMDEYNDTLIAVFRYPCMYSTDIQVYEYTDNYIERTEQYTFDALYDCDKEGLLTVNLHNNAAPLDYLTRISSGDIVTGKNIRSASSLDSELTQSYEPENRCDPDYKAEYYRSLSLGNAKEYITVQEQCCEYCKEAQDDGKIRFFANPNCFELDIEATSSSINHFQKGGNCKIEGRSPCTERVLMGRAKLDAIAGFVGDVPSDALIVEAEFYPSGHIEFYSSGYLNCEAHVSGTVYNRIAGSVNEIAGELITYFEGYTE